MSEARCKACNVSLSEESVYALGNDRWHVECFKCSTCKKKLTEEMNMLALGDGLLVCSECSFSCAICEKKIVDVAVLTNDKAYCSDCFVCKKCKSKIEDLHYARTSQGIFCMSCHQVLLEHKRQRQKQKQKDKANAAANGTASATASEPASGSTSGSGTPNAVAKESDEASKDGSSARESSLSPELIDESGEGSLHVSTATQKVSRQVSKQLSKKDLEKEIEKEKLANNERNERTVDVETPKSTQSSIKDENEKTKNEKTKNEGNDNEKTEREKIERDRIERENKEKEQFDQNRIERERIERERIERERNEPAGQPLEIRIQPSLQEQLSSSWEPTIGKEFKDELAPAIPARSRSGSTSAVSNRSTISKVSQDTDLHAKQAVSDAKTENSESKDSSVNVHIFPENPHQAPNLLHIANPPPPVNDIQMAFQLSPDKNIRFPRKKLAPSAFQNDDSEEFHRTGDPFSAPPVPSRSIPGPPVRPQPGQPGQPSFVPGHARSAQSSTSSLPPVPGTPRQMTDIHNFDHEISVPQRSMLRPSSPNASEDMHTLEFVETPKKNGTGMASILHRKSSSLNSNESTSVSGRTAETHSPAISRKPVHSLSAQSANGGSGSNNSGSKSPFSRLLRKRNGDSPSAPPLPPIISNPTNFHKRSISDNSADGNTSLRSTSNGSLSTATMTANSSIGTESSTLVSSQLGGPGLINENENDEAKLTQGIRRLRDEYRILARRNAQLTEMNMDLERQIAEKLAAHPGLVAPKNDSSNSLNSGLNSTPSSTSTLNQTTAANASSTASNPASQQIKPSTSQPQQTPAHQPPQGGSSFLDKPFVTVLQESQQKETQTPLSQLRSTKNWLFRRPHRTTESASTNNNNGNGSSNSVNNGNQTNSHSHHHQLSGSGSTHSNSSSSNNVSGVVTNLVTHISPDPRPDPLTMPPPIKLDPISLIEVAHKNKSNIPFFVTRCFDEVEKRGLNIVGIYRKPGSKPQVDLLLKYYSPSGDLAMGEQLISSTEIHTITSAVKQYMRRFTDPVIPFDCYEVFIAGGNSKQLPIMQKAIDQLPKEHLATLRLVMTHLALVSSHESKNLMNARNLAMVFAPTIARDESGDREVPDMQAREDATLLLLLNQQQLLRETTISP